MNEERLEFLYNTLRERSLVDPQSNFEQFRGAYATTDRQQFLYDALRQRQLVDPNSSFTQFQSAYFTPSDEVKKKDTATQAGLAMAGGPDSETPAIPGVVGDLIRSVPYFGDFVDDIYRAGAAGLYRGASTTEVFKGAFGGELDEDDYDDILANMRTVNQYGQSDEAKQFQKEYEEADGFFDQLYVMATNPTAMGEVMVGSIAQMVTTATAERGGLATMAAGAATAAPVGLAGGPFAGVTVPAAALSGAVGALSGATDATATMLEIIREELDKGGMELTKDNLQAVFQDQDTVKKMRSKALSRGIPIAVMDAVTMGVAGKVVQTLGAGVKGTVAGGIVEIAGGGAGEAAAQVVSGDPLNQGDILLEAAAEGPMVVTSLVTGKRPKYTVGGQKVSRQDFENYINSGEDLTKAEVKNDPKLQEQLQEQKEKSGILKDLPEDMVEADRMRAMELERERGKKAGSKLEVNKKRVSDIDTELKDIYRRYFDEGQRKTEEDKGKKTVVPNADEILSNIGKVRPKTLRGLYEVNKQMFGLDEEQALANTIIMDRMIGQMANRAGVEKQAMYGEIGFVKGDEATAQGLRENGTALFQNDFSDVETGITYRYDKNTDEWAALEEDGTITRNKTLADFEGEPMLVHGPDVAFSGSIMVGDEEVVKGQGGMYYPIKYLKDGAFWASKGVGPTNQAIASLNKSGRTSKSGNGYMVLMTGGFDKILNSFTGFGSVMNILNHVHEKGLYGVSQTRFQKALRDAYKTKFKGKAVFDKGVVAASGGTKDMVAQLVEDSRDLSFAARAAILDNFFDSLASGMNRSTVENRVAFKKFLAGDNPAFNQLAFRGRALIKKTDLFDGFSYMIGEPFLRDMKRGESGSYAYAVLEAVRPEGMNRNADLVEYSGDSKHDSYPSVIKLKEGVKFRLHALNDHSARYEDSFKHPQTGTMKTPTGANVFGGQIQMGVDVMQVTGVKPKDEGPLFQIVGPNAQLGQDAMDALKMAMQAYEEQGDSIEVRRKVKAALGWEKGVDGKWKYEIEDGTVKEVPNGTYKLSEVYDAPELFKAYPEVKDLKVTIDVRPTGAENSWFIPETNAIEINVKTQGAVRRNLIHELQHYVQFKEGFAIGGNMDSAQELIEKIITPDQRAERSRLLMEDFSIRKIINTIDVIADELGVDPYDIKAGFGVSISEIRMAIEDEITIDDVQEAKRFNPSLETREDVENYVFSVFEKYKPSKSTPAYEHFMEVEDQEISDKLSLWYPYQAYQRMAGEVEARVAERGPSKSLIEDRADYTPEEQLVSFIADETLARFQGFRGAMVRKDSKAIIYSLTSPDVSTPLHEMAHVFEHYLTDAERKQIMEWAGTKEWNRDTSEAFAEGFEAWLAEGGPQENSLFNVYDSFKKWMLDIYEGITGTPLERKLNDPMRAIYAEMTGEAQTQRQQQEASQPKKMRRFSQRVAQNVEELREDIINNPNSYYEPQKYAEIRDRLAEMTHEELITEMVSEKLNNLSSAGGQIGVMAGIERMNRALAEGDFNTVNEVQEKLAKIGTAAGQILRQFGELRTSTPDNLVRFIEAQMKNRGREMNDAQRKRITDIANRYMQAQAQYKETIRQLTFDGGLEKVQFDALEAQAEEQQNRIGSIEREIDTFSNTNIERGWGDLGSMLIQGNLLTPMSQVTNIFANAVNATLAIPRDIAAKLLELPTRAIAKAFGKETQPSGRQFSISAYLHGARQFGRGVAQSAREAYTGETSDVSEWRIQRGFAPQRSLLALLSPKGIAVQRAKRKGVEVDSPLSSNQKAKLWVQGTFGIPAEIMFRLLSLGDTPFRRYMEGIDIYQAALEAGVTRDKEKLRQFLKYPPRKALEAAQESGRALTFQQETAFSRNAQRAVNGLINYAEQQTGSKRVGDVVKFILRSNVPYIKTPANILLETLEYAFLPLAAVKGVMKSSRGDVRGATQSFAKGFLGYMVGQAATELIKQGLMSGEPEWGGDEAEKNLAYDQFPPSSINVTGLQRYLAGGDPSVQPGDVFRSYKKLGIPGVIMGAKTMIPVDELPDDKALLDDILDNVYRSTGTLNYFLDQSFIQGINNLLNVLTETNPDRVEGRVEKWVEGTMKAMMAAPLPNTLSAVHRAEREFLPDVRVTKDETPGERLYKKLRYTILDRTFGGSEIPVRINWKGLPIQQTPPGASAWQYNLLDVTKARQGEADPVSNEIYRLYEVTDEISKVVSTPSFAKSRTFNVPSLKRTDRRKLRRAGVNTSFADDLEFKKEKIAFSVEQLNQLMQVAGQQRYAEVQDLINSSKYARMSDEQRLSALDKVAAKYNGRLEDGNRPGVFADHSVLLMQFIQQLYDGRQEVQGQ